MDAIDIEGGDAGVLRLQDERPAVPVANPDGTIAIGDLQQRREALPGFRICIDSHGLISRALTPTSGAAASF